jgi:hypothetical protein
METEESAETLVFNSILTWLIAQEDFSQILFLTIRMECLLDLTGTE